MNKLDFDLIIEIYASIKKSPFFNILKDNKTIKKKKEGFPAYQS